MRMCILSHEDDSLRSNRKEKKRHMPRRKKTNTMRSKVTTQVCDILYTDAWYIPYCIFRSCMKSVYTPATRAHSEYTIIHSTYSHTCIMCVIRVCRLWYGCGMLLLNLCFTPHLMHVCVHVRWRADSRNIDTKYKIQSSI